ncbi:glucosaminidase [Vibrio sp. HA2012]|uniref:glucosaminidase domain-containing protein n=1 Tax=Vibrio sp. HA2012 TaxID=1971595 RepID=UPI000C2C5704|nr:glucosaminidase domain-containing protein [Vibrio sp. HA2012]PJC87937.1 glucosaminidase [Vibrio sp. HA2012]
MHKVVAKLFENTRLSGLINLQTTHPIQNRYKLSIALVLSIALISCVYHTTNQSESKEDILVIPSLVTLGKKPDFGAILDITEKKRAFFAYLVPGIKAENQRILNERHYISGIQESLTVNQLTESQLKSAEKLAKLYQLPLHKGNVTQNWLNEMKKRVNVLPETLVLTQAANESAWGTSRFAQKGNNYFGQWCYQKGCGLIPLQRNDSATHEVAKFPSAAESIHRYFMNVNRNQAYSELRNIRANIAEQGGDLLSSDSATQLANGLIRYSERGQDYVDDLQAMIRHNDEFWQQ